MGAVIHSVMVLLSCGLVRYTSSFLPVFSVSSTFPLSLASCFGVEQLVIVLGLAAFSRLCRYFH